MEKLVEPFHVLFESNPLPMWVFDSETLRFLDVNQAAIQQYGYSREEFLAMTVIGIRPPEDIQTFNEALANMPPGPFVINTGEWRHCRKDHSLIYVTVYNQPVVYAGRPARLSMLIDITGIKEAENALRRSEKRLNEAQQVAHLGSWEWDIRSGKNNYSDELFRIFNLPPQAANINVHTLVAATHSEDKERFRSLLEEVARTPKDFEINIRVKTREGVLRQVHACGEVTRDADGNPIKMTGTAQDVTERMLAEEERLRNASLQAANKELEAFSYTVSHDLRTPLRSVDAFSRLLDEEYGPQLDENARSYLELIRGSATRMNQLIEDLIEFSRVTSTVIAITRTQVDLSLMVQGIARELERANPGRKAEWRITQGLKANADPRLIRIVLENLINNAWKFTGKTADPVIEFGSKQQDHTPVFFVRDNGAGFDMEFAGRLFGVFQRLHSEHDFSGTGIGLAIVQRVIARHGGQIWAEGAVNKGATFYFTLPG